MKRLLALASLVVVGLASAQQEERPVPEAPPPAKTFSNELDQLQQERSVPSKPKAAPQAAPKASSGPSWNNTPSGGYYREYQYLPNQPRYDYAPYQIPGPAWWYGYGGSDQYWGQGWGYGYNLHYGHPVARPRPVQAAVEANCDPNWPGLIITVRRPGEDGWRSVVNFDGSWTSNAGGVNLPKGGYFRYVGNQVHWSKY